MIFGRIVEKTKYRAVFLYQPSSLITAYCQQEAGWHNSKILEEKRLYLGVQQDPE